MKSFTLPQVLLLSIIYTLIWVNNGAPVKTKENTDNGKRLAIQVVRTARAFVLSDPKKQIEDVMKKTKISSDNQRPKDFVKSSNWETALTWLNLKNLKKRNRFRTRRRRHKRGAKINHDDNKILISQHPTNRRLYKLVNRLGYFIRIHLNGSIDGTFNKDDVRSK